MTVIPSTAGDRAVEVGAGRPQGGFGHYKGSGANLPAGVTALLTTTSSVTIQLRSDNAPAPGCWTGTLSTVKKQTADFFKAK